MHVKKFEEQFPGAEYKIFVINLGYVISKCSEVIKFLISEQKQSVINLCCEDYLEKLLEEISIENIPQEFGGDGIQMEETLPEYFGKELIESYENNHLGENN